MIDEIENIRYEFDQRDRQGRINTEIHSRLVTLEESHTGLAAEIRHLMQERNKGIERIKLLESRDEYYKTNEYATRTVFKELKGRVETLETQHQTLDQHVLDILQDLERRVAKLEKDHVVMEDFGISNVGNFNERLSNLSHSLEFCLRELDKKREEEKESTRIFNKVHEEMMKKLQDVPYKTKLCLECKGTGIVWGEQQSQYNNTMCNMVNNAIQKIRMTKEPHTPE